MKRLKNKKKYKRIVFKSGNSLVIAIPSKLRKITNISEKDILNIYEEDQKIILERTILNE